MGKFRKMASFLQIPFKQKKQQYVPASILVTVFHTPLTWVQSGEHVILES